MMSVCRYTTRLIRRKDFEESQVVYVQSICNYLNNNLDLNFKDWIST